MTKKGHPENLLQFSNPDPRPPRFDTRLTQLIGYATESYGNGWRQRVGPVA